MKKHKQIDNISCGRGTWPIDHFMYKFDYSGLIILLKLDYNLAFTLNCFFICEYE